MKKLVFLCLIIGCSRPVVTPGDEASEDSIILATNEARKGQNLSLLKKNAKLMKAAHDYAKLMAEKDRLSHDLESLSVRVNRVGYNWNYLGENIAWNQRGTQGVMESWLNSPGHRRNIVGNFVDIGVGIYYNSKNQPYYCQVFGK